VIIALSMGNQLPGRILRLMLYLTINQRISKIIIAIVPQIHFGWVHSGDTRSPPGRFFFANLPSL
jgi:hypothetical protein